LKELLLKKFLEMAMGYLKEELPRLKKELCDYSDEWAKKTDNEWDDLAADLLRSILGVPK